MTIEEYENTKKELEYDDEFDMPEAEIDFRFREAVRISKEIAGIRKQPTCEYDMEKEMAYLLYPDGHREYPTID